ncbi:hypothetical protein CpMIC6_2021 [Corynebacterium pseudotuberculosis]|nr:Hypothetical protein Cp3995_1942 [Corynebacterium pseudotuberculosis 3/99-5]AQU93622.1 hypothetical protein CpMIC6_2021 [Corynebacterium pseudotuberculosis]
MLAHISQHAHATSMTMIIQPAALSHLCAVPHAHAPVLHMRPSATASALDHFLSSAKLATHRHEEGIANLLFQVRETITLLMETDSATSRSLQTL